MADEAKRKEMKMQFMRMAKKHNWNITKIQNKHNMKHRNDENDENTNSLKANPNHNNYNNKNTANNLQSNTEICPTCGSSISLFLIDNHKKHCRHNMEHNHHKHNESSSSLSPAHRASPLRNTFPSPPPSPLYNELIACKYCEYECNEDAITEHEFYCASRTDLCDICGARDTLKNLKDKIHQCNIQNKQNNDVLDLCSSDSEFLFEAMDNELSNSHNHNNHNNHNHSYYQQSTPQVERNKHNHSFYNHSTPQLIRAERERIEAQKRLDHEFAMNLQQEIREQKQSDHELAMSLQREMNSVQSPIPQAHRRYNAHNEAPPSRRYNPHNVQRNEHYHSSFDGIAQELLREHNHLSSLRHLDLIMRGIGAPPHRVNNYSELRDLNMSNIDNLSYEELNELFPNEAQGAKEETIDRLPTDIFHKKEAMNDDRNKCCICLEQFENGEEIRRLQCLHIFHKDEIDEWLRQNKVCPICRIDVEKHI